MKSEVQQRALGAMVQHALLRWETVVTIVVTAILFLFFQDPFPWWQDWFWLVGGAIAEGALIYSTMTDPEAADEALAREFESQYDIGEIRNAKSRDLLRSALEYRRSMLVLVRRHHGALRSSLRQTVSDVNDWIDHMYRLAQHIDAFESNELVERDMRTVPQQIDRVKARIDRESDEAIKREYERQLQQLEQQWANPGSVGQQHQTGRNPAGKHALVVGHHLRADVAAGDERGRQRAGAAPAAGDSG